MLYDVESMRRFAGLSIDEGFIPDESAILKFRHFLGEHDLTGEMFSVIDENLGEKRLRLTVNWKRRHGGDKRLNRKSSRVRSFVEHCFNPFRNLSGHRMTR